jgi:hypothetical protein
MSPGDVEDGGINVMQLALPIRGVLLRRLWGG